MSFEEFPSASIASMPIVSEQWCSLLPLRPEMSGFGGSSLVFGGC